MWGGYYMKNRLTFLLILIILVLFAIQVLGESDPIYEKCINQKDDTLPAVIKGKWKKSITRIYQKCPLAIRGK